MRSAVLALLLAANASIAGTSVSVAYAGSLVTPMERSIAPQFIRSCSCAYYGEGRGSGALVHLIVAGLRHPDVFISADPALMHDLLRPRTGQPLISWYATFAHSRLVLGYSRRSSFTTKILHAARKGISVAQLLKTPHLRIGRTDPRIDPKGAKTLEDVTKMSRSLHDPALLKAVRSAAPLPEEDLLVRLESGDVDVAFLYSVEARSRNVPAIELPRNANAGARYAVTQLKGATNKPTASAFIRFIISGLGKRAFERMGLDFVGPSIFGDRRAAAIILR